MFSQLIPVSEQHPCDTKSMLLSLPYLVPYISKWFSPEFQSLSPGDLQCYVRTDSRSGSRVTPLYISLRVNELKQGISLTGVEVGKSAHCGSGSAEGCHVGGPGRMAAVNTQGLGLPVLPPCV